MTNPIRRTAGAGLAILLVAGLLTAGGAPASAAPVRYEAENANIINGVVESNHVGFTGTGFVNSANALDAAIEFDVRPASAGSKRLVIRYTNGTTANRPARITINGTTHSTPSFPPTGAWTTWMTQTITATLTTGSNLVRLTATTAGGLGNIDSLTDDDGTGGMVPVPDPMVDPAQSNLGLTLTQFAQFPRTNPVPTPTDQRLMRHARINFLGQVPGSSRLYVPDLNGRMYTLPATGGTPTLYLDVRARVGSNFFSGRGMGSGSGFITYHPDFATNGKFYTTHSEAFGALTGTTPDWTQPSAVVHSVVTEWTATNPAATTFSGTRRTLMRIGFASYLHAIQQIDFNPTAAPGSADYGKLYLAVGDGGIGFRNTDPQRRAIPHGKILRIDPQPSGTRPYSIPPDNPFVGQSGLGEIWAVGMRDPHRFSWDTGGTHRMLVGHIGEHAIEGIYDTRAGDNLGWSEREGAFVYDRDNRCTLFSLPANDSGFTYPVAGYDHPVGTRCGGDAGRAIAGGFVYRGSALPALQGKYVFGDLVQGWVMYANEADMVRGGAPARVFRLRIFNSAGNQVTMQNLAGDNRVDLRFGLDRSGELYVMSKANGRIWKVTGTRGSAP